MIIVVCLCQLGKLCDVSNVDVWSAREKYMQTTLDELGNPWFSFPRRKGPYCFIWLFIEATLETNKLGEGSFF